MKQCEKCGKEVLLPFTCTYCGKEYCNEHRLPESHECSNMPREPPPYISPITVEAKTPEYKTESREKPKTRKSLSTKKVIGAVLAVIIISALLWYAQPIISYIGSHVTFPSQENWNTETFQLVQASIIAPVMITRHYELQSGNHLVGNFQFAGLPSSGYEIGVAILDPLQGTLQVFINKTSGSFDITASISGAYEMNFGFTCTRQVTPPSVTLKTRIAG